MKRIQTLIQSLLLVSALTFSGSAFAGFNFGGDSCADGSGTFSQAIPQNETAEVGVIPVGMSNVKVNLTSPVDVDIQLIDVLTDTPIVHWQTGVVQGASASCATYEDIEYCYSGYAGVDGKSGHEYIHINGTTNREVKMLAFGYDPGDALVEYSWEAPTDCVDAGSGEFDQTLIQNDVVEVGTIPAGKQNVEVNLEADADVDIEIYHGDKAIVAWKCADKPSHSEPCLDSGVAATVDYEGMTLSYSGFNGMNGHLGHEFIKIEGELTQPITVKVVAYEGGTAKVTYSWGPKSEDTDASAATDDTSTPVAGESTPSNTPDPASYCGDNMGFDSGINMCIIQPEYTAAKNQCDADLTAANTAKSSCESAKQSCDSDLAAANTAKTSCESTLAVTKGEKTDAMSELATCQFDLTASQATAATGNTVLDPKTHWLSSNSSFELLKAGHDCTSSDSKIGVVNTAAECAALCEETSGCEVFIVEHTSGTPAKCWAESATKTNCSWKSGAWDAYGLVPATTYTSTPLSECSSDQFESKASTLTSDRECSTTTQCTSNQYELTAPTATSDRVCQDQPTCAEGEIVTIAGTSTSPQVCENPCPAGQYKDVAADACVALTACTDEEVETKAPTAISDRECGPTNTVIYTYQEGNMNTAGHISAQLQGADGSVSNCLTYKVWNEWNMECRGGMTGSVSIQNLPHELRHIHLTGMAITELVTLEGLGFVGIDNPTYAGYNFVTVTVKNSSPAVTFDMNCPNDGSEQPFWGSHLHLIQFALRTKTGGKKKYCSSNL